MNIKHNPITNTEKVCEIYSQKEEIPISYVCTTEMSQANVLVDIFYRSTPHPEFGNKYFGLFYRGDDLMIANTDSVENLTFGTVQNDEGSLEYSRSRHDYRSFKNGNMIDGGRDYIRSSGDVQILIVRDGKMIEYG